MREAHLPTVEKAKPTSHDQARGGIKAPEQTHPDIIALPKHEQSVVTFSSRHTFGGTPDPFTAIFLVAGSLTTPLARKFLATSPAHLP